METLLSILPNLSIGVVCIGALVYVVSVFVKTLDQRATAHESAMLEREKALRTVEADVRETLLGVIGRATTALEQNSRVMGRVVDQLDRQK